MIELSNRLKEKFPNFDPLKVKESDRPVNEDVNYDEFDNISSDN
jgi:hypothetical protein